MNRVTLRVAYLHARNLARGMAAAACAAGLAWCGRAAAVSVHDGLHWRWADVIIAGVEGGCAVGITVAALIAHGGDWLGNYCYDVRRQAEREVAEGAKARGAMDTLLRAVQTKEENKP